MTCPIQQALAAGNLPQASARLREAIADGLPAAHLRDWFLTLHPIYALTDCEHLARALVKAPDATANDLLPCARLLFQSGRYTLTAALTKKCHQLSPTDPDPIVMLASALERDGQVESARQHLADALALSPNHPRALRLLAHLDRLAGKLATARATLESHLSNHTTPDDWRLRYELAAVLDREKKYPQALAQLLTAKAQLAPSAPLQEAQILTSRLWQVTQHLTPNRLKTWRQTSSQLTPKQPLCLLAGFPRSGTTLLENILTSHPGILGTDESGILHQLFEKPIVLDAPNPAEAIVELDEFQPDELSAGRADYLRATREHLGQTIRNHLLLEKEPLLTSSLTLPLRLFPEAKIILPLRDPRDVVISYLFTIVPLAANSAASLDLEKACQHYADTMRHWLLLREHLPQDQWIESRYEDLLADPETQTKKLAAFLELPWSAAMLAHHKSPSQKAVTTPTYHDVSRPLYTRALARWKNYREALTPHLPILEPYLRAFGYQ